MSFARSEAPGDSLCYPYSSRNIALQERRAAGSRPHEIPSALAEKSQREAGGLEAFGRAFIEPGGPEARRSYEEWRRDPRRSEVTSYVQNFQHRYLFEISRSQVRDSAKKTGHALGNVRASENIPEVRDFDTPFAHQYLFHEYLERFRTLPTWQD